MSLVIAREGDEGRPVHFPKQADVFKFDEEVAEIFEDMAARSIPFYPEIHRLHCSLLRDTMLQGHVVEGYAPVEVWDVGSSTGRWFKTMRHEYRTDNLRMLDGLVCRAFDNSEPMLAKLRAEFSDVEVHALDLVAPVDLEYRADVVVLFYVLQFIPERLQFKALMWIYNHMKSGGVLILGQKESVPVLDEAFQREYIRFRKANGYTQQEIDAKTAALKNSMWCQTQQTLRHLLLMAGFKHVVETTRWLQFSTYMVYK